MKNILIINGHSAKKSLSKLIADTYENQIKEQGHAIHRIDLGLLKFDPILREGYGLIQELESDLIEAQKMIKWADHTVWIFPVWWSSLPALLKGFFDRTFLPGFAFKYSDKGPLWDKLLIGKSADVIYTSGTPSWVFKVFMGEPVNKVLKGILGFSGLKPMRVLRFGGIRTLTEAQVAAILEKTVKFAQSYKE